MKRTLAWSSFLYLWFAFLLGLPLYFLIQNSLGSGIAVFIQELTNQNALVALKLSLIIAGIVVALSVVFGLTASLGITRGWMPGKRLVQYLFDIPFSVPPVIGGLAVLLIYGPRTLIGAFLLNHHVHIAFALPGMVLATLFVAMPLMVRELVPVLEAAGTLEEQAATTLGASAFRVFWQITLPRIKWGLLYGIVLTLARSLGEFGAVLILSGDIIGMTQTATQYIYLAVSNNEIQSGSSVALVLALISFTVLIVMEIVREQRGVVAH